MQRKITLKPAFTERMQKLLSPADLGRYKKSLETPSLVSIRCNTLKISPNELKKKLEYKGWKLNQPWPKNPEVFVVEGKFVSKEEADEIEKRLMNKGINVNIRKNFDDENNVADKKFLDNNEKDDKTTPKKIKALTINNKSVSEANLTSGWASDSERILINLEPGELGRSLEHLLGYYYIQDLASMLPVIALEPQPNEKILDLCASPGSKTTQISACMKNTGNIIANEVSLGRIKILASNLERCGCTNSVITRKEGVALCKRLKNQGFMFDKILIDAPCSGEGTLRNSPKTAIMWNPKTIKSLSKLQKTMVENSLEILKPNGIIVYSTCTHAPEENEEVLDYILSKHDNIKIEPIKLPIKSRPGITNWEDKQYSNEVTKSCRIYPQDTGTEGFFVAKLRKGK